MKMKNNWPQVHLEDVCDITSSKRIFANEYRATGVPFYRGKEIIEKQKMQSISTELFIEIEKFNEIQQKYGCPIKGDMLLTSVGTLGAPYIVKDEKFYF
jgi:type I restriction enzyme S subunit